MYGKLMSRIIEREAKLAAMKGFWIENGFAQEVQIMETELKMLYKCAVLARKLKNLLSDLEQKTVFSYQVRRYAQ